VVHTESILEQRLPKALVSICCMLLRIEPLNRERAQAGLAHGDVPKAGGRSLTESLTLVLSDDDERVATWRQLAPDWQDLWLRWDGQRGERKDKGQAGVDEAERLAFVRFLVAQVYNVLCFLAQPNY
jgi:hypothetical protein